MLLGSVDLEFILNSITVKMVDHVVNYLLDYVLNWVDRREQDSGSHDG